MSFLSGLIDEISVYVERQEPRDGTVRTYRTPLFTARLARCIEEEAKQGEEIRRRFRIIAAPSTEMDDSSAVYRVLHDGTYFEVESFKHSRNHGGVVHHTRIIAIERK